MKNYLRLEFFLVVLLSTVFLLNCERNVDMDNHNKLNNNNTLTLFDAVVLDEDKVVNKTTFTKELSECNKSILVNKGNINHEVSKQIISEITKRSKVDLVQLGELRHIGLYVNNDNNVLSVNNILGISFFALSEEQYPMHYLLIRDNDEYLLEDDFTSLSYNIHDNMMLVLHEEVMRKSNDIAEPNTRLALFSVSLDKEGKVALHNNTDMPTLGQKVLENWEKQSIESRSSDCPPSPMDFYLGGCWDACLINASGSCYQDFDNASIIYCCKPVCGSELEQEELEVIGSPIVLDLETARNFRDNMLTPTDKGQEYIGYYGELSTVTWYLDLLKSSKFNDMVELTQLLIDASAKLQSPQIAGNTVIVDQNLYDKSVDMINFYLSVSPDTETTNILNTIRADLDLYYMQDKNFITLDISN